MNKEQIINVISWILILLAVILLIWTLFGKSTSEFYVLFAFLSGLLFKTWSISDKLTKLEVKVDIIEKEINKRTK